MINKLTGLNVKIIRQNICQNMIKQEKRFKIDANNLNQLILQFRV